MKKRNVLITGSSSFLGHHILPLLRQNTDINIICPTSKELNLLDKKSISNYFKKTSCDEILHMAAVCGGITANNLNSATFLHDNVIMASNLYNACHFFGIDHVYQIGSICSYPEHCQTPFKEKDLWNGYPEPTNAGYGFAKKLLLMLGTEYNKQFGYKFIHLMPANMYGENDNFGSGAHVIPDVIKKLCFAKKQRASSVMFLGTGKETREFLYAGDCAQAIYKAICMKCHDLTPINIGTGNSITISELINKISSIIDYNGEIKFNNMLGGQPKRQLDVMRAKNILGFEAKTDLNTGLAKTYKWYSENVGGF